MGAILGIAGMTLWLGKFLSFICNWYLFVAARQMTWSNPSLSVADILGCQKRNKINSVSTGDQQIAMDTLPSTSEGIYEAAYGDQRPKACCPRVRCLPPTAEESTFADPPGHHLSLSRPAGRFKSDQQMAVGISSDSSEKLYEETYHKRPKACCPRVGYLHPTPEEDASTDPPCRHLSVSRPVSRFTSDQQTAVRTSSSSSDELHEETHVKRPWVGCPRVGYLHPSHEENTPAGPAGHCLPLSGPSGSSESDQQLTREASPSTSEGIYDQTRRVRCCRVTYLRLPPEQTASADPADGQLSVSKSTDRPVSVWPKSSIF